jgi:hypothetical protein
MKEERVIIIIFVVVRKGDEPRIVHQTKRNVKSEGVVQMRCNAGEAGDRG